MQTEVELESGQSFVIAGLLDNQVTESLSKIPGIGNIPLLGKLFQSKTAHQEQLRTAGDRDARSGAADSGRASSLPELKYPVPFLTNNSNVPMRQPGMDKTGPVPVKPPSDIDAGRAVDAAAQEGPGGSAGQRSRSIQLVPIPAAAPPANPIRAWRRRSSSSRTAAESESAASGETPYVSADDRAGN